MTWSKIVLLCVIVLIVILAAWMWVSQERFESSSDRIILLIPDGVSTSDPRVSVWLDAASEEGLHLTPVHDSELVRPIFRLSKAVGVILPDSIHQRLSDILLSNLQDFVAEGGKLLLVYDAGTLLPNGSYSQHESRLSQLAGISYALYDTLKDHTTQWSAVHGLNTSFDLLEIPPGKYYPFLANQTPGPNASSPEEFETALRRYQYGQLQYPSFVTSGTYSGRVLLQSDAGVVAGEHSFHNGSVLFVNLPLGYLKGKTDGLMLHAFLKYFAVHKLGLPHLLAVPDGIGGLVLNWHVDSNAAIRPMQEMDSWSLLRQGPYSVHITAGPDSMEFGDHRGFDAEHNVVGQELIRRYLALGYSIGSHGGWIHDYFSEHVETGDPKELEQYLQLNKSALEHITGRPVVEYSAPNGDQPPWVTSWLDRHGFLAYYFTGDTGMGPTQGYRGGVREAKNVWAFPILHLDRAAAFEEMHTQQYSAEEAEQWLRAVTAFTINDHLVRLVYFHPTGVAAYHDAVDHWMELTSTAKEKNEFRWYTMTQIASFLNNRKRVRWKTSEDDGALTIVAAHPQNLAHFAWQVPAGHYAEPNILKGNAAIRRDGSSWIIVAEAGKELEFQCRELQP